MEASDTTRRSFYSVFINGLGAIITAVLAVPAAAYLLMKPNNEKSAQWVEAADVNQLQVGKPEQVAYHRTRVDGWRTVNEKTTAWVVKMDDHNVVAYTPQCTHLGCAYHWDASAGDFLCPCHTSIFSIDGKVVSGPAPRPLDRFVTRIDNGKLLISPTIKLG
jgi:menaquinol-cytochrome c reductase iron-sulfur subunit